MDDKALIKELIEKNAKLEEELLATKEHLKKYTAPASRKEYYENNKEAIKERNNNYKKNTDYKYEPTPEKKKEYARRAYLKKKEKLQKEQNDNI
tara:strand:+ start:1298 stop:1579 length:282 start_codon:yes stop_codon:yes gene_type:complete